MSEIVRNGSGELWTLHIQGNDARDERDGVDAKHIIETMTYRIFLLTAIVLACVSCSTEFQAWEGRNSVVEGRGGTRSVVDGMDVWTHGDPPRRFRVLGIIEDNRPGGPIPMARMKHDVVAKARQSGGDAVILVSSSSQLRGYYTSGSTTAHVYGNSASAFQNSTTIPITHRTSTYVVIKYL